VEYEINLGEAPCGCQVSEISTFLWKTKSTSVSLPEAPCGKPTVVLPCQHLGGVPFVEEIVSHEITEDTSSDYLCEALEAAFVRPRNWAKRFCQVVVAPDKDYRADGGYTHPISQSYV